MEKRVCAGRSEGYYIEGNSMKENEVEDENVYAVERVVDERKRKVITLLYYTCNNFYIRERKSIWFYGRDSQERNRRGYWRRILRQQH